MNIRKRMRRHNAAVDKQGVGARVELEPRFVAGPTAGGVVREGDGAGFVADAGDEGGFSSVVAGEGRGCEAAEADDVGGQAELPD